MSRSLERRLRPLVALAAGLGLSVDPLAHRMLMPRPYDNFIRWLAPHALSRSHIPEDECAELCSLPLPERLGKLASA